MRILFCHKIDVSVFHYIHVREERNDSLWICTYPYTPASIYDENEVEVSVTLLRLHNPWYQRQHETRQPSRLTQASRACYEADS